MNGVTGDDSTASSEMSSIREEPKTRAQRIPQSHGLNTVISNKKLSFVDLETANSSSESKMSQGSMYSIQPKSAKNIESNHLFNNYTDDIDQATTLRENLGINIINDTKIPSKQTQKQAET